MSNPKLVNSYPRDNGVYSDITLRDLFAAAAMTGMLANEASRAESVQICGLNSGAGSPDDVIAHFAWKQADAMLAARDAGEVEP